MRLILRTLVLVALMLGLASAASAQSVVPGTQLNTMLRVTVLDQTEAALVIASVTIGNAAGVERTASVNDRGVVEFDGLTPGPYQVTAVADGFRTIVVPFNVRRGQNQTTMRLAVAVVEQNVAVQGEDAAARRDNGFTQTLTQEEIDALPDDPDEMAEELMRMAGPGAQIFINGFRGGRLPPKDQIQQIRFNTNSFSAEYHEAGMVRVEVITKPGFGDWRGMTNFGFRDESLNAKNAFAPSKGAEQMKRYMLSFSGPLAKGRTGLSLSFDGNNSYDSRTILAQSPAGQLNSLAVSPLDAANFSARLEHQITAGYQLQAEYAHRLQKRKNLGVGDFDLPERGFATDFTTDMLRVRNTGVIGKKVFSETRFVFNNTTNGTASLTAAPILRVNDAFTAGGAGQSGERHATEIELAQNFDFTIGRKHSMRAGVLFESGWWDSDQRSNAFGSYTFTSLDAFYAATPATYTIRVGDPIVSYTQTKVGWFIQDDFRPARSLQMSVGIRQELQTQVDSKWHFAPRAAVTWNATKRTTVRGGYGIFYDWYDTNLYEQTIRVDGAHQVDVVVQNPSFPVLDGAGTRLPPSVIRAGTLGQPLIQQASFGVERPLTPWMDFRSDYMWTRGHDTLRSVNVNAPISGARPNPLLGNVTEIQSTGKRASDRLTIAINARQMQRRIMGMVMYQLASARNFADGPLSLPSNSHDPNTDWGPAAQDVRHRVFFNLNAPIARGVRLGLNVQGSSALPYTVTTGGDDNGDTIFNDRPAGVTRNSERGASQWTANLRLNKSIGLGGPRAGGPQLPGPLGVPAAPPSGSTGSAGSAGSAGSGGSNVLNQRGPGGGGPGGGGDGPQMVVMEATNAKYRVDIFLNVQNAFNNTNYNAFIGNLLSPFYGVATSAAPARRVEVGFTLGF